MAPTVVMDVKRTREEPRYMPGDEKTVGGEPDFGGMWGGGYRKKTTAKPSTVTKKTKERNRKKKKTGQQAKSPSYLRSKRKRENPDVKGATTGCFVVLTGSTAHQIHKTNRTRAEMRNVGGKKKRGEDGGPEQVPD